MTRWQQRAYRFRLLLLIFAAIFSTAGITYILFPLANDWTGYEVMGLFGTPLTLGKLAPQGSLSYGINALIVLGVILMAQWAFLRPRRRWAVELAAEGRPLKSAVIVAGLMASMLTIGLAALLLELPNGWEPIMGGTEDSWGWKTGWGLTVIWAVMLMAWAFWALVFLIYWRQGDRYTQLGKMIRGLITASLLEAFVAVPVHVWATRQRECYCCRGTYTTLVLAGTVLLWAFGPGILLLYMRQRHRAARVMTICRRRGYDLRGTLDAGRSLCPECGQAITH